MFTCNLAICAIQNRNTHGLGQSMFQETHSKLFAFWFLHAVQEQSLHVRNETEFSEVCLVKLQAGMSVFIKCAYGVIKLTSRFFGTHKVHFVDLESHYRFDCSCHAPLEVFGRVRTTAKTFSGFQYRNKCIFV